MAEPLGEGGSQGRGHPAPAALLQRLADWRATRSNASLAQAARPSAALALIFGRRLG